MEFDATKVTTSYMDYVSILKYIDEENNIRLTVCIIKNHNNKFINYINITKIYPYLANNFRAWKKRTIGREYMTNLSINTGIHQSELTETIRKCQRNITIHGLYVHYDIFINVVIDFIINENVRSILLGLLSWHMFNDIQASNNNNTITNTPNNDNTYRIRISELAIIKILDTYEEVYRVSKEKECGICFEVVYSKPLENDRYFGILDACEHTFCVKCIHTWTTTRRLNNGSLNCPVCRTHFRTITSSKFYKHVN
ncbi:zinc finger-like protein [Skunkpox virus]|uniref:Zinc finger-like protein n=1 Tax=Skunkpox virus TaxID=160796 RepID=A0A1C9KBG4_9POXV|nr:zinc finger-like protein [Skunkpox virus]AOP31493.1 zinc finger-like protein [Skunkpox virus]